MTTEGHGDREKTSRLRQREVLLSRTAPSFDACGNCFGDRRAGFNFYTSRRNRHPAKLELSPQLQRHDCAFINLCAATELNTIMIDIVTGWSAASSRAHFSVREGTITLSRYKGDDVRV